MSDSDSRPPGIVTRRVEREADRYRWYVLRYLQRCTYPASVSELSEHVGPRVGGPQAIVEERLLGRDLPALAECGAIEYDPESHLVCLGHEGDSFADRVRRAIRAGVVSHLKPPRFG